LIFFQWQRKNLKSIVIYPIGWVVVTHVANFDQLARIRVISTKFFKIIGDFNFKVKWYIKKKVISFSKNRFFEINDILK